MSLLFSLHPRYHYSILFIPPIWYLQLILTLQDPLSHLFPRPFILLFFPLPHYRHPLKLLFLPNFEFFPFSFYFSTFHFPLLFSFQLSFVLWVIFRSIFYLSFTLLFKERLTLGWLKVQFKKFKTNLQKYCCPLHDLLVLS